MLLLFLVFFKNDELCLLAFRNALLVSIPSTYYVKFLRAQIPQEQKDIDILTEILCF